MMTPVQVAKAHTARITREARKSAVTYSTSTPAREHLTAVEFDGMGKHWSHVLDSEVTALIDRTTDDMVFLSDIEHSWKCWCQKG